MKQGSHGTSPIRRRGTLLAALLLTVTALAVGQAQSEPVRGGDLSFVHQQRASSLDANVWTATNAARIMRQIYDPLVWQPEGGVFVPGLATRWEVSEDGRRYLFRLRPEARWSNGDPLTAADFVWSFLRVLDPETAAPGAYELYAIEGALDFATGRDGTGAKRARDPARVGVVALDAHTL